MVGFHGHTIFHSFLDKETNQLGDGKLLSRLTGLNVVCDFRTNDIKNGGQGAPLVPIFHKLLQKKLKLKTPIIFVNIGGISNLTYINEFNENGCFYTEFWHDEEPLREHFLKRNRIVAGISEATIIIESAEKGGSLVTADIANSYSRDVFAVPGKTTDVLSKGCNNLIKWNKAGILTSAQDLIDGLNWEVTSKQKAAAQKQLFVELNTEEQKVYDYLLKNGKQYLDSIALECQIPVYKMATLLFNLEMKGVLRPLQGKLFEVI